MNAKKKVLLVDDDADFLEMTRSVLEAGGYRVACAIDPGEAWNMVLEHAPDLVITDLMMQTMSSGFSLSRKIKETPHCRSVPVIIMTSAGSRLGYDLAPRGLGDLKAMHADAFLEKPMLPEDLLGQVADLLGGDGGDQTP